MPQKQTGPRYQVTKMVDAKPLHPKSGIPLAVPPVPMPYRAILEDVREERGIYKFTYLGKPYQCDERILGPAITPYKNPLEHISERERGGFEMEAGEPVNTALEMAAASTGPAPDFEWESIRTNRGALLRANVPGGWLVCSANGSGITFLPDAKHAWKGKTG